MQANNNRVTIRIPGDLSKQIEVDISEADGQKTKTEIVLTALRRYYSSEHAKHRRQPQEGGAQE